MPLWTPANIHAQLLGWWDAADSATLFDSVSGGSATSPNGYVRRWEDKGPNAVHVTQSGATSVIPRRTAAGLNALDVVAFDGNDWLESLFVAFGTAYAIVAVVLASNMTTTVGGVFSCRSTTAVNPINPQISYNTGINQFATRDDAGTINTVSITGLANNTWYMFGGVRSGNSATVYRDGTAGSTASNALGTTTPNRTTIGGLYAGSSSINSVIPGRIAEIVMAPPTEINRLYGYLAHKWGLSASLPADHLYKSSAPRTGSVIPLLRRHHAQMRGSLR